MIYALMFINSVEYGRGSQRKHYPWTKKDRKSLPSPTWLKHLTRLIEQGMLRQRTMQLVF